MIEPLAFSHAAMEVLLVLNGIAIQASVDQQEDVVLAVASGQLSRAELADWVEEHLIRRK